MYHLYIWETQVDRKRKQSNNFPKKEQAGRWSDSGNAQGLPQHPKSTSEMKKSHLTIDDGVSRLRLGELQPVREKVAK